jgi:hypothetical protein
MRKRAIVMGALALAATRQQRQQIEQLKGQQETE